MYLTLKGTCIVHSSEIHWIELSRWIKILHCCYPFYRPSNFSSAEYIDAEWDYTKSNAIHIGIIESSWMSNYVMSRTTVTWQELISLLMLLITSLHDINLASLCIDPVCCTYMWQYILFSRTPKQTPHFDTRSEINPSRTLVKNEIMKTLKKCTKHRKSCEKMHMALFLVRDGLSQHSSPILHSPKGSWKISETCAEINPSHTRNNAICISSVLIILRHNMICLLPLYTH